ncbi:unnamed protein product [Parajaminaea phylloscopi]
MSLLRSFTQRAAAQAYRSAPSSTRSFVVSAQRAQEFPSSSKPAVPTPATTPTSNHYGASGDESAGRNLPAEQKDREELAVDASIISDAPPELHQRSVRIFKPTRANTSGRAGTNHWKLDFDILQGSARWENPLMGWASSADYMQATSMRFRTLEDAERFCQKQGWDYFVQQPHTAKIGPKSYAANYSYVPDKKLRIHHTK